jgi:hypothetical protein
MSNNHDNNNIINIKTFRHEFGKVFMEQLSQFSKVHQYDDRHTYKSEWTKWTQQEEIAEAIETERRRLHENGYTGDVNDKMFKAGRYYFRKKTVAAPAASPTASPAASPTASPAASPAAASPATATATAVVVVRTREEDQQQQKQQKQQKQQRRPYITMSKEAIRMMDAHIQSKHTKASHAAEAEKFKPSSCYDDFYQTNMSSTEMTSEIEKIIEKYQKALRPEANPDQITTEIIDKIKKTYKNRYYKYVSSQ